MTAFRKKPVEIQAHQYLGFWPIPDAPEWLVQAAAEGVVRPAPNVFDIDQKALEIKTMEGRMFCPSGNFIIQGVKGEIYSCDPEIFDATYEEADNSPLASYPGAMHPNAKAPENYVARFNALTAGDEAAAIAAKQLRENEALEGEIVDDNLPAVQGQSYDAHAMHPAELDPKGFLAEDMAAVMVAIGNGATDEELDKLELPSHNRQDQAAAKAGLHAADEHINQRTGAVKNLMINHSVKCPTCAANAAALAEREMQLGGLRAQARDATKVAARTQTEILQLANQVQKLQLRHMSPDQGELAELRTANSEQAEKIADLQLKLALEKRANEYRGVASNVPSYLPVGVIEQEQGRFFSGQRKVARWRETARDAIKAGQQLYVRIE